MYKKVLCFGMLLITINNYAMVPGRVFSSRLATAIVKQTLKVTPKPIEHSEVSIYEKAAEYQTQLRKMKKTVQNEIAFTPAARREKRAKLAALEQEQMHASSAAWLIDMLS